jgi:hypothetical protein
LLPDLLATGLTGTTGTSTGDPDNRHFHKFRHFLWPPAVMIVETFFLVEEKRAIRTQSFQDLLGAPSCQPDISGNFRTSSRDHGGAPGYPDAIRCHASSRC